MLEEQKFEQQPTNVANLLLSLEAHGFPHCSLTLNPIHTEAMQSILTELSDKDGSARVAHIYGSAYINPARLATHAALAMRQRGSWTTAVYCSLQVTLDIHKELPTERVVSKLCVRKAAG